MDLDHCLSLLERARTDNEKMASLLLVAKAVKSGLLSDEQRRKVFDAVGFSFVNRLLATEQVPEDCTVNPYHKLAVTILACFCTDKELVSHPEITAKIPRFNEFIQHGSSAEEGSSLAEDSLHCLQALALHPLGLESLLSNGTLEALAKCFLSQNAVSTVAKELLVQVMSQQEAVEGHLPKAIAVMNELGDEFQKNQDALKFELCDTLYFMLSVAGEGTISQLSTDCSWLSKLSNGLRHILSSKIGLSQRNSALQLSALLCHLFGIEWAAQVQSPRCGEFFKLLVHLVGMEVHLALEGQQLTEVFANSALVSSCFMILEQAVGYVSKLSDMDKGHLSFSEEDLLQLHKALTEAFTFVVQFLQNLDRDSSIPATSLHCLPVVQAAVRVLGAWLAEESLALSSEVCELLPFLLKLCSSSTSAPATEGEKKVTKPASTYETPVTGVEPASHFHAAVGFSSSVEKMDLLKFLLPGLSNLTAQERPRKIMLESNLLTVLLHYLEDLSSQYANSGESEMEDRLSLCCGVLLNVCVTEPQAVKEDKRFLAAASCLIKFIITPQGGTVLHLHAVLLFLIITRRQGVPTNLSTSPSHIWTSVMDLLLFTLRACPHLPDGVVVADSHTQWNEVSELWFLAMQELTVMISDSDEVRQFAALKSSTVEEFNHIVGAISQQSDQEKKALQSVTSAVCCLLQAFDYKK